MITQATIFAGTNTDEPDVLRSLTQNIDRFGRERIDAKAIDREHRIPRELLREAAVLGLFGLSIPEEHGGAGFSLSGVCTAIAALARWDRSLATTVGLHLGLGTRPLVAFGSAALRERYLPDLAAGSKIAAFATTEPAAGSDLSAIRTTATATATATEMATETATATATNELAEANALIVRGDKIYVTNGGLASVVTITASTPSLGGARRGHSLLLLEREDKGVDVGPEESKLGLRGSSTVPLYFDDVRVPMSRVIGEPGKGMSHLEHVLAWGRTAMAAGCTGAARTALMSAVEYVTARVQFGKRLAELDVVKAQVAKMAALCFSMEALVSAVGLVADDPDRLLRRSISAKVFASESDWTVVDMALQLHGGSGFIEETPMPMLLRDARITRIFEGANDVLLVHAGTIEIAQPDTRPDFVEDASPRGALAQQANAFHRRVREKLEALKAAHGLRLLRRHLDIHALGRLVVLRDACDAAVARAIAEGSDSAHSLAQFFLDGAQVEAKMHLEPCPPLEGVRTIAGSVYAEVVG
ncbi:MAG: acyl-CoA dehydrogenase family protein [Deltaproteobacteria bacterium]|nr:acyl-CoA dehydrogenase family protein [Deltaproteobacteria bacterium]